MPSAEEILNNRNAGNEPDDTPVAERPERIATDYPETTPKPDRDAGLRPDAKEPEPAAEPEDDGDEQDDGRRVPLKALHAEREKSKRYTEEVRDLHAKIETLTNLVAQSRQQPPQSAAPPTPEPTPDFDWDNPALTIDQRVELKLANERKVIGAEFQRQREALQSSMAMQRHGPEVVKEAYVALADARERDPQFAATYQQIMTSPDQYEALVQWHKRRKTVEEIGDDLDAYKARIRAEYLEELRSGKVMDDEPAAKPSGRPAMPSNLSAARSVGSRNGAVWSGPTPLKDIFANR